MIYHDIVPQMGRATRVLVRGHLLSQGFGLLESATRTRFYLEGWIMILKLCNKCGKPCAYPAKYCGVCLPGVLAAKEARDAEVKAKADKAYNARRDPKYVQFYRSKPWRMLSARYMQDHTWRCEKCGGLAVEVHHKQPIQTPEGWERRFDVTNLMAVCVDCHNKEHKRFQSKG
jgi:5-methylcytosine-specific restriction endonuclease McrA